VIFRGKLGLYIKDEYRGLGIGKTTLIQLETDLMNKDVKTIRLYVFAHNLVAYNLYTKLGYEKEATFEYENKVIGFHFNKNLIKIDD
jgi:ribosomal protein S18 acetylase RimI-like enzyme